MEVCQRDEAISHLRDQLRAFYARFTLKSTTSRRRARGLVREALIGLLSETALQAKAPEKNRLITADPTSLEKPVIPDA